MKSIKNQGLAAFSHAVQLLNFIVPFVGLIAVTALWRLLGSRRTNFELHARAALNFQYTVLLYNVFFLTVSFLLMVLVSPISINAAQYVFTSSLYGCLVVALLSVGATLIYCINNTMRALNGEQPHYPMALNIVWSIPGRDRSQNIGRPYQSPSVAPGMADAPVRA